MRTTNTIRGLLIALAVTTSVSAGQSAADAGQWKTWIIASGSDHGVPPPPDAAATRAELDWLREISTEAHPSIIEQMRFWDSGPPSYRWMDLITKRQSASLPVGRSMVHAYTYVSLAIYDATVAAWNAKYAYQRSRPSQTDSAIRERVPVPRSPSYPSD